MLEYHNKIAEIFNDHTKSKSVKDFLSVSRLWRLETGDTPLEVEEDIKYEKRLPM